MANNVHSRQSSNGMVSLMKVLNDAGKDLVLSESNYDADAECDNMITTSSTSTSPSRSTSTRTTKALMMEDGVNDPIAKASYEGKKKKYVWDNILEEEDEAPETEEGRVSAPPGGGRTVLLEQQNKEQSESQNLGEKDHERIMSLRSKIKAMKQEHDLKSGQVMELKTAFARKKVALERRKKVIKDAWQKRFSDHKLEHEKKESELQELLVQTNTAIEKCLEKKKVLRHDISHVEERRRNLCNSLVDKGKKELLKFQQKWKQDERKRLCQLEKQKTATMKKEAAKALEPELRRIVQQYKNELQRKENDINDELETFKGQLKLEIEAKMAKCKRDLDAELRQLIQRTDEEYQQKVDKLKLFHEQQIKETQKEANEEFQSMITHHQEKEELLKAKLQTQQCSITLEINEAKALMQNELKKLQNIIDEEAHDMAEQTKTQFEQWKMAQVHILENEATKVKGRKVQEAYLDSSKKIKIVKEKLDLEIESMRVNKTAENHLDSNLLVTSLGKDIENALQISQELEAELETMLKNKEEVMKQIEYHKQILTDYNNKCGALEISLKMEAAMLKEREKDLRDKESIVRQKTDSVKQEQGAEIQSLEKAIEGFRIVTNKWQEQTEGEIIHLTENNRKELLIAEGKIQRILTKQYSANDEKLNELSTLKSKSEELDLQLETARKHQYVD